MMELPHLRFPVGKPPSGGNHISLGFASTLTPTHLVYYKYGNAGSVDTQIKHVEDIEKPIPSKVEERQSEVAVPKSLERDVTRTEDNPFLPNESLKQNFELAKAVSKDTETSPTVSHKEKTRAKRNLHSKSAKIHKKRKTIFDT